MFDIQKLTQSDWRALPSLNQGKSVQTWPVAQLLQFAWWSSAGGGFSPKPVNVILNRLKRSAMASNLVASFQII